MEMRQLVVSCADSKVSMLFVCLDHSLFLWAGTLPFMNNLALAVQDRRVQNVDPLLLMS